MKIRFALAALLLLSATAGSASTLLTPNILLSTSNMSFGAAVGATNNPTPKPLTITNSGSPSLTWTGVSNAGWLTVAPPTNTLNHNQSEDVSINVNVLNPPPGGTPLPAGNYTGKITFSGSGAAPVDLTVNLSITAKAQISLTPGLLSFSAAQGAGTIAPKDVTLKNTGGTALNWSVSFTQSWIHASFPGGSNPLAPNASVVLSVSVDNQSAAGSPYNGKLRISDPNANNTPQDVDVTLTVSPPGPLISLSPSSLTFDAPSGGGNPVPQSFNFTNIGGQPISSWTATTNPADTWVSVSPNASTGPLNPGGIQPLIVSINTSPGGAALAPGTYQAPVTVAGTGATNTPQTLIVTLTINTTPKIGVNPKTFSFSVSLDEGVSPPAGLSVSNTGSGTLQWSVSGGASWLGVSPGGGSLSSLASQAVLLTANTAGLSPGTYSTTIQIENALGATPPLASNSPQTISVDLTVTPTTKPTSAPAGQCGLSGLEGLLPVLAFLLRRRLPKRGDVA